MGRWIIRNGRYWANGRFQKNTEYSLETDTESDLEVVLNDDDLVVPGLIDFHLHLWAPGSPMGIASEKLYADGIVACADAGSFGYRDWLSANRFWQNSSKVIVKSWLSVLPNGLIEVPMRIIDPSEISVDLLVAAARKAEHGTLLGFKVPIGWKDADTDRTMLRITREAADRTGLPIMTHVSGACIPLSEIITYLRKGDVISHIYSGLHGREVLNGSAEARDSFRHAKERGIVMDIAFGVEKHFSWNTFLREFGEGLAADTVSTDVVDFTYKCPDYPVSDLYGLLSALYAAGVNRDELYRAVIDTPAKQMGIDLQSLNNTLVIRPLKEEERSFSKTEGVVTGDTVFSPMLFVDRGRIITDRLTCRDK